MKNIRLSDKIVPTYHVAKKSMTTNLSPAALSCSFNSARVAHCLTILTVFGLTKFSEIRYVSEIMVYNMICNIFKDNIDSSWLWSKRF